MKIFVYLSVLLTMGIAVLSWTQYGLCNAVTIIALSIVPTLLLYSVFYKKPSDATILAWFTTRLTTPIEDLPAYKFGIIDENGNQICDIKSTKEARAYGQGIRFTLKIRRLVRAMSKDPTDELLFYIWCMEKDPEKAVEEILNTMKAKYNER